MKKLIFCLIAGFTVSMTALAGYSDIFSYNNNQLEQRLSGLQLLENFIRANPGVTLAEMES